MIKGTFFSSYICNHWSMELATFEDAGEVAKIFDEVMGMLKNNVISCCTVH